MKVLHIVASRSRRGAEVFASDLIRALKESAVDQRVSVLRRGSAGIEFDAPEVPSGRGANPFVNALRALGWRSDWRPDVIQAHGGEAFKRAVALARIVDARVVYRRIGSAPRSLQGGVGRLAFAQLIRRADVVVTVADAVREESHALFGLDPGRVVTIPNGVDPRRITPVRSRLATRRSLGLDPDQPVVMSLGALRWEKDPMEHLAVMAEVIGRCPSTAHVVVGDGPLRLEMTATIDRLGIGSHVRMLGVRDDIGDLLGAADILLFGSRVEGMEGMPAAVIEAGMAGVPVAGYSVAGVPEVVLNGVTGLLSDPGETTELQRHVERLIVDQHVRARLGAAARRRCSELYDITRIAERYQDIYRTTLSRPRRARGSTSIRSTTRSAESPR